MAGLSPDDLGYDPDLVARTMLGEAGNQGDTGLAAVAHVIRNRVTGGDPDFPTDVTGVIHQRNAFTSWNDKSAPNYPKNFRNDDPQLAHAKQIADGVFSGQIADPTGGATYFANMKNIQKRYSWMNNPQTAQIGGHTFFAPQPSNSQSDPAAIAKSLGIDPSLIVVNQPQYTPVSSGGGVTVMLPSGGAKNPTVDPQDVARSLGIDPSLITAKPQLPANMQQPANVDIHAPPDIQAAAAKVVPTLGFPNAVVEGMPIVGPAFNAATAASNAAIQSLTDSNAPQTFAERFSRNAAIQDEAQRQWSAAHPIQALTGNLIGGGMLLGPLGQSTIGAAALGLPNPTRMGATVGGRIYTGMAGGAAIGAADAAMRGQSPTTGAIVGGAGGAAGPAIGQGVGTAVETLSNALRPAPSALTGINTVGRGWLANAVANETPASIAAARDRMGPQGFLADVNPGLTELAAGISNRPEPPASSAIGEAYRSRDAAQRSVINDALTQAFGPKIDVEGFKNAITENRAAAADPLYQQWRSMQVPPTPALKALHPRLESTGAFDEAQYLANAKGTSLNQKFFTPGANKEFPTPETWDLVKRGLDSKIEQAYSGGNKTRAAALVGLKNELIDEIGKTEAGQVWNQARREFADRSELLDQIEAGKDTFLGSRSSLSVDQMREELRGLSGPELAARIVGARNAADEVMGATRIGDTTLRNKFLAPNNQEKLRLLLGDAKAQKLIEMAEQQEFLAGQSKYVNPRAGSATTPRKEAVNALEPPPMKEWNPKLTEPLSFIPPHLIEALRPSTILQGGRTAAYAGARQQVVPALLAKGNAITDLLAAIRQESAARSTAAQRGSVVARGVTALAGPGSTTARIRGNFKTNALMPATAQ